MSIRKSGGGDVLSGVLSVWSEPACRSLPPGASDRTLPRLSESGWISVDQKSHAAIISRCKLGPAILGLVQDMHRAPRSSSWVLSSFFCPPQADGAAWNSYRLSIVVMSQRG